MKLTAESLPDDPHLLKQIVQELTVLNQQAAERIANTEERNRQLELLVRMMQKRQFGRSSENSAQLDLLTEEAEVIQAELEQAKALAEGEPKATAQMKRPHKAFPASLEREPVKTEPDSTACSCCDDAMKHIGDDVTEVLDVKPVTYTVKQLVRPKYACKACNTISQAPAQPRVIDRGAGSAALIAQVIVDKYCDHLPLYRQSQRFEREGIDLSRSTLADWVGRVSGTLMPLVSAMRDHVLDADKLHADETTAPTLKPGNGKTHTGYYWAYARDDRPHQGEAAPAVWFQYSDSRKGSEPAKHLKGFKGTLLADAYAGYNLLLNHGVKRAGCWAHVRRKFVELTEVAKDSIAADAVKQINALYDIEREINGLPPDERRRRRQLEAIPILEQLKAWLDTRIQQCVKRSPLANAIQYARKQWPELVRYADDGQIDIDNNAVERCIRPLALGRKNHLFAGSAAGGATGAVMYTLMGTAKLNGINPLAYLTAVLKRINETPITEVADLLPWNIDLAEAKYAEAV